jgi:hypothetical protein
MTNAEGVQTAPLQAGLKQASAVPIRKVTASGIAGAVAAIVVYVLNTYYLQTPIPGDIAAALTTVLAFGVSYGMPPAPTDRVVSS